MQDDTALYGAKMMQPVMTPADSEENNLRPQHLEDYIGQEKTTLAGIIANEMGVQIRITSGPAIEKPGDLAALLTNLQEGDVLFIDEIHTLVGAGKGPGMYDVTSFIGKEETLRRIDHILATLKPAE